jgi:hypothetical protein
MRNVEDRERENILSFSVCPIPEYRAQGAVLVKYTRNRKNNTAQLKIIRFLSISEKYESHGYHLAFYLTLIRMTKDEKGLAFFKCLLL